MSRERFYPNDGYVDSGNKPIFGISVRNEQRSMRVLVTGSPTLLPSSNLSKRLSILVTNNSSDVIYIGASNVDTTNGTPLYPREKLSISIIDDINIYAISSGTSSDCRIWEGG